MKHIVLILLLLILILPSCSLRKEKKKPSVHQKRKASQMKAYASNPNLGYISPY